MCEVCQESGGCIKITLTPLFLARGVHTRNGVQSLFLWCMCCVRYVEKVLVVGRALGLTLLRSAHHPTIIRLSLNKVKVIIGLISSIITNISTIINVIIAISVTIVIIIVLLKNEIWCL